MNVNYPLVGGALITSVGAAVWRGFLWSSLRRRSLRCTIDKDANFELRTSVWAYFLPLCGLSLGAFLLREALNQRSDAAFAFCLIVSAFLISGAVYYARYLARVRVIITADRLVYSGDGKTKEIEASEVLGVKVIGYSDFYIHLRWDQHVTVPATFHRSDLIFAFLRQAMIKNRAVNPSVPPLESL